MDHLFETRFSELLVTYGEKIALAIICLIVGKIVINLIIGAVGRVKYFNNVDQTAKGYINSFLKIGLWVVLLIIVIQILGVPMASVITVLASAGLAIGLALQGALSNIAGGVMLMIFRPFSVGDYVQASGVEGTVRDITLFYTTLISPDNKRITIPNSQVMNTTVTNLSSEKLRRVDLDFSVAKDETPEKIQSLMLDAIAKTNKVLQDPAPFARLTGGNDKGMNFQARAWCKSSDYWAVYFDLTQNITEAMGENDVKAPAARVIQA